MIKCVICGHEVKSNLCPHLNRTHGITGPEYEKKYKVIAMSDNYREHLSKIGTSSMTKHNKDEKFRKENSKKVIAWWAKPEVKEFKKKQVKKQWEDKRDFMVQSMLDYYQTNKGKECIKDRVSKIGLYKQEYNGIIYKSSWEIDFAKFLEKNNIKFEYESKFFEYLFDNKNHIYVPDFYLPEYNLIIEVKPDDFIEYEIVQVKAKSVKNYNFMFISKEIIDGIRSSSETIENRFLEEISKMRSE